MPAAYASPGYAAGNFLAGRGATPVLFAALALFTVLASPAAAATVRITGLQDVTLPALDPGFDASASQSICVYSDTATKGYSVTIYGSGAGSAYALSGGAVGGTLAYELQWNQSAGKTSGTQLSPGAALTGQVSTATQQRCSNGPSSTASLIFILRSTKLQPATAGIAYTGTITIVIAPE
jgi:hypothetical protein